MTFPLHSQCTSSHAQVAKLPNAIIKVRKCHHNLPQLLALAAAPLVGERWALSSSPQITYLFKLHFPSPASRQGRVVLGSG